MAEQEEGAVQRTRKALVDEIQALAPHEVTCNCGEYGTFGWKAHFSTCPRKQVGQMLAALTASFQPVPAPPEGDAEDRHIAESRRELEEERLQTLREHGALVPDSSPIRRRLNEIAETLKVLDEKWPAEVWVVKDEAGTLSLSFKYVVGAYAQRCYLDAVENTEKLPLPAPEGDRQGLTEAMRTLAAELRASASENRRLLNSGELRDRWLREQHTGLQWAQDGAADSIEAALISPAESDQAERRALKRDGELYGEGSAGAKGEVNDDF